MDQQKLRDFKETSKQKYLFRKVDQDGQKINWRNIKWLRFTSIFGIIYFKETLKADVPFRIMKIHKRGVNNIDYAEVPLIDQSKITITISKKQDLLSLLPLMDSYCHEFYKNLRTNNDEIDLHPDDVILDDNSEEY